VSKLVNAIEKMVTKAELNAQLTAPERARFFLVTAGQKRPVTYMAAAGGAETRDPVKAVRVVVFFAQDDWRVYEVTPGEVFHREDAPRDWEPFVNVKS
jgi:anion-transporting  ArsA/GET3 family ATPase